MTNTAGKSVTNNVTSPSGTSRAPETSGPHRGVSQQEGGFQRSRFQLDAASLPPLPRSLLPCLLCSSPCLLWLIALCDPAFHACVFQMLPSPPPPPDESLASSHHPSLHSQSPVSALSLVTGHSRPQSLTTALHIVVYNISGLLAVIGRPHGTQGTFQNMHRCCLAHEEGRFGLRWCVDDTSPLSSLCSCTLPLCSPPRSLLTPPILTPPLARAAHVLSTPSPLLVHAVLTLPSPPLVYAALASPLPSLVYVALVAPTLPSPLICMSVEHRRGPLTRAIQR